MLKLGIDIDGTIKNTHQAALNIFNQEFNRNIQLDEVHDFLLDEAFGLTREEGAKVWSRLEDRIYTVGIPLPHAQEILQQLKAEGHQIYFITARPDHPTIVEVTKRWLLKHRFPYDGENLIINAQDKGTQAKRLGINLFFEDAPEHLQRLQEMNVPTVIVDALYNRAFNLPRIHDWREVPDLVTQIKNRL